MPDQVVNMAVFGAAGRMGRQLLEAISERSEQSHDAALTAAIEMPGSPAVGVESHVLAAGLSESSVVVVDQVSAVTEAFDVLIDFTRPGPSIAQLPCLVENRKALIIGTTGYSADEKAQILEASQTIPIVHASNYSVGVTLSLQLLHTAASILGDDYDVEIIEAHHRNKVDAPSGTAISMGESVADALNRDLKEVAVYGREGHTGVRDTKTIGFETIRGGDIIGDHTVLFAGQGERLEITHKASNRMTFARGAIRAAQWVASQKPGLYDMADVIGLK